MRLVKPVFSCDKSYKHQFKLATCLLPVSLGQEAHEGEKFRATLQKVSELFASCVLLVGDVLQRHTIAIEMGYESGDSLQELAWQKGNEWLQRNELAYSEQQMPLTIVRWQHWVQHPQFCSLQQKVKACYESDLYYRRAFEETCEDFMTRYYRRNTVSSPVDDARVKSLCLAYLFEECAAMCLWPELGCEFEVYPSYRNAAMDETHKRFVLPTYPKLLHAVRVKFKSRTQLLPQMFEFLPKVMENRASL